MSNFRILRRLAMVGLCWAPLAALAQGLDFGPNNVFSTKANPGDHHVTLTLPFTNTADRAITIQRVVTSCGCTAAVPAEPTIAPGATSSLEVSMDLRGRQGLQTQRLEIVSDDPTAPNRILIVQAEVPRLFDILPRLVRWTPDQLGQPQSVRIEIGPDSPYRPVGVEVENPAAFSAELIEREPGRLYEIVVKPLSDNAMARSLVTVRTEPPVPPELPMTVYLLAMPPNRQTAGH